MNFIFLFNGGKKYFTHSAIRQWNSFTACMVVAFCILFFQEGSVPLHARSVTCYIKKSLRTETLIFIIHESLQSFYLKWIS